MRGILLLIVVGALCPISLLNGRYGLYAYTWFALMRPDYLAWVAGNYPFSLALAVCALIGCRTYYNNLPLLFTNPICIGLLLLLMPTMMSAFNAVDASLTWDPINVFVRVIIMAMLIPLVILTKEHFRELFLVIAFSMGIIGSKYGYGGFMHGGAKYYEGYGGFLADNNCAALAFAMVVPLCWYGSQAFTDKKWRYFFQLMAFGSVGAVIWTHSRGGLLALAIGVLPLVFRSRHRIQLILVMTLVASSAVYLARDTLLPRITSAGEYENDSTAQQRLMLWDAAIEMWKDYPYLGVGFGSTNFMMLSSRYTRDPQGRVAHNTYLQILADSGIFAFTFYILLMLGTIYWLGGSAKRMRKRKNNLEIYPLGLRDTIVIFAIGSFFLSRVTFDFYYIILMAAAAWYQIDREIIAAEQKPRATVSKPVSRPITQTTAAFPPVRTAQRLRGPA